MLEFTGRMGALVDDLVRRLPELSHVRTDRLLLTLSRARRGGLSGTFARIYPLRFEAGADRFTRPSGGALHTYEMPPVVLEGRSILYIITFLLPRFQNLSFDSKLATIVHELYHVGPRCDGDIRRFPGKNFAHGPSRDAYDRKMTALAAEYLSGQRDPALTEFLEPDFRALDRRHGGVTGVRFPPPVPRLVRTEPAPRRGRVPPAVPVPGRPPAPEPPALCVTPLQWIGHQLPLPFPPTRRPRR